MINVTNIMVFPLVLILGFIDMYFLLLFVYWLFGRLAGDQFRRWRFRLGKIVLPPVQIIKQWLNQHTNHPVKSWISWVIVVVGGIVIRQLIVMVIASTQWAFFI